jgi:hypothetical protein
MKHEITIEIDRKLLSFLDDRSHGNRSEYLNSLLIQERRKILADEIIAALEEDNLDPEYQAEIAEWDRLSQI